MGARPRVPAGDRVSVRMELRDALAVRHDLFVLAGYPHPTNDWGWHPYFNRIDDSDWNQPWDDRFWRGMVELDPAEVGQGWDGVELEVAHDRVLVRSGGRWSREILPAAASRLRLLPGVGVCAVGGGGLCVRRGPDRWQHLGAELPLADAVADGDRLIGVGRDGAGVLSIKGRSLRFDGIGGDELESACASPLGVVAGGAELWVIDGDSAARVPTRAKKNGRRFVVAAEPGADGSAIAVASDGALWRLSAAGWESRAVKIPKGFLITLDAALHGGDAYVACGDGALRGASPIALPAAVADTPHTVWPRCGAVALRATGGALYACCDHQLARTTDGRRWELVAFR